MTSIKFTKQLLQFSKLILVLIFLAIITFSIVYMMLGAWDTEYEYQEQQNKQYQEYRGYNE